ncbi:MAG: type II secretion system F family protein [bacterium]|nr:type II secretion system F family protein [bacterium]
MKEQAPLQSPLSLSELERFCHFMGQSLRGGLSFVEALRLYSRTGDWDGQSAIQAAVGGESAASALKISGTFPELLIGMVEVGEASGKLDQTFLKLADYYRELIRSGRVFRQGISWPLLQLIAATIVLSLLFFALDYLQRKFTVLVVPDLFGLGLQPLQNMGLVIGCSALLLSVFFLLSRWWSRGRLPSIAFRFLGGLPWIGTTLKRIATARFAWTLGAALDAGTDAITAARLAVRGSANADYRGIEKRLSQALQDGKSFEEALESTGKFPPELIQAVAVGESTGQVTECVQRLSLDYDEQNAISLRQFGQVSGMAMSLSVVLLLGFTVVSMYAQYLGMVSGALRANSQSLEQLRDEILADSLVANPPSSLVLNDEQRVEGDLARLNSQNSGPTTTGLKAPQEADNELIQTRDRMVNEFIENNGDFQKIESIYGTLSRFNELSPNDFLDAIVDGPKQSNPRSHSTGRNSQPESKKP